MKSTAILEPPRADELSNRREPHRTRVTAPVRPVTGPVVIGVRGPTRSGKTAMCERLIAALSVHDLRVGWVKRTHHEVDTPGKASDRIWSVRPAATALRAADRLQVTVPPGTADPADIFAALPPDLDVILLETHEAVDYPVVLSTRLAPDAGEVVLGTWSLFGEDEEIPSVVASILRRLPADRALDRALRAAIQLHGGHACAGTILGTRMAITGAAALGVAVPDRDKRLLIVAETERCAVDGLQAVTGCRPGKRTLRMLDYGKLAATFLDEKAGRAIRVSARGDLRERVGATGPDRYEVQREAYLRWPAADLFIVREVPFALPEFDRPGPPKARVRCIACDEEVSDGRHVDTERGPQCRPCWAAAFMETKGTRP